MAMILPAILSSPTSRIPTVLDPEWRPSQAVPGLKKRMPSRMWFAGHHFLVPEDIQDFEIDEVARMEDQFGVVEVLPDDIQEPLVGPPEMHVGDDADLQT
jgi:hypothetical protein